MSAERGDLEENLITRYRFVYENQENQTTDELPEQNPQVNDKLAELGREDEDCEVVVMGYTT